MPYMICKLTLLSVSLGLLLVVSPCNAQSPNKVFNIRPANQEFLRYNRIVNSFATAIVAYEAGELEVGSDSTWQRVVWNWIEADRRFQGDTSRGADYSLASVLESSRFQYNNQDSVRFYRMASLNNGNCDNQKPPSQGGHGNGNGNQGAWTEDDWWSTLPNDIHDTSVFVIEVVRDSDDVVVGSIDSVWIGANPSSSVVPHGGTSPNELYHVRDLPDLDNNTSYYFRIKPIRYGVSPYGMSALQYGMWINFGYIRKRDSVDVDRFDPATNSALLIEYADSALAFIDSVYWTTGTMPNTFDMPLFGADHDTLIRRYYDSVEVAPGLWSLVVKPRPSAKQPASTNHVSQPPSAFSYKVEWDVTVFPNPVHDIATVQYTHITFKSEARIRVVDNVGVTVFQTTHVLPQCDSIELPLNLSLPVGTYSIIVYDYLGHPHKVLRIVKVDSE